MGNMLARLVNFAILGILLPFVYGCGGGGGGSSFLGSGSSSGDSGIILASSGDGSIPGAVGSTIATIYNPEPATMLLLGSGLAAFAYLKNKRSR